MPATVGDLLSSWFHPNPKDIPLSIWNASPAMIMWSLWIERNNRVFRKIQHPASKIWDKVGASLAHIWYCYSPNDASLSNELKAIGF